MTKILILGGGFGGIRAALDLEKKLTHSIDSTPSTDSVQADSPQIGSGQEGKAAITLVDKNSYHLFVPALYEVASAYGVKKDPFAIRLKKTICIPYSDIFENKKINFVQAEIFSLDLENKRVVTGGGEILDYDYLVMALGSQAADFSIPGVKEYAFQFKNLEDGLALNQKIDELVKKVASGQKSRPVKIAIVGAGFTGIEVAAEIACCVKKMAKACLPSVALLRPSVAESEGGAKGGNIKDKCGRIILFEAGPKILPAVLDNERNIILKRLTRLGIEVMEGAAVEEILSDCLKLKNGKNLDMDLTIWAGGICLPKLLENTQTLPLTEKKKIEVNNKLEVVGLSDVFAVGDSVEFIDPRTNKPIPALAYVAVDQGRTAARNIIRLLKAKELINYNPFYGVWIAPIGGKYALAHLWGGKINIKGFWGWVLREVVDFKYMLSILSLKKAIALMWQEITLFTKND